MGPIYRLDGASAVNTFAQRHRWREIRPCDSERKCKQPKATMGKRFSMSNGNEIDLALCAFGLLHRCHPNSHHYQIDVWTGCTAGGHFPMQVTSNVSTVEGGIRKFH
jgi:hypothetical protein